jgi:hypothetical protein
MVASATSRDEKMPSSSMINNFFAQEAVIDGTHRDERVLSRLTVSVIASSVEMYPTTISGPLADDHATPSTSIN